MNKEILCIRIKPETKAKLTKKAEEISSTPSQIVRMIVENYFKMQ